MDVIKSYYYQFVNFIQGLSNLWFVTIWLLLVSLILVLIVKFFKIYDGSQKKFEKLSLIIIAVLLIGVLVFLTYIRK